MQAAFNPEAAQLMGVSDVHSRVPGNVHYCFPAVSGESLVLRLDLAGIAVSSGSACHSAVLEGSHVLQAMACESRVSKTGIRFSFGQGNTLADVERVVSALVAILSRRTAQQSKPLPAQEKLAEKKREGASGSR
jgi:cysteine desulfurase